MIMMFILGVLFGWLLEALFVKFVLGKPLNISSSESAKSSHAAATAEASAEAQALTECEKEKVALSKEVFALQESMTAEKAVHEKTQGALTKAQAELDACNKKSSESVVKTDETSSVVSDAVSGNAKEGDDLTKLGGIGPKIASLMKAAGIGNFAKIADTDVDTLCEELTKNGIPYSKVNVATWAEQARYAQQGDWQGLKSYQEGLKA